MRLGFQMGSLLAAWLCTLMARAAKDVMSVEDYHRLRNHLEDQFLKVRIPAMKFAETILK